MRRDERANPEHTMRDEEAMLSGLTAHLDDVEPLEDHLIDAAIGAYVWRNVDSELLELLIDSNDTQLQLVRDQEALRVMAFGQGERGIHFECRPLPVGFNLEGAVEPPVRCRIMAQRPSETVIAVSDDAGTFRLGPLPPGTVRLVISDLEGTPLTVTPWFVLDA